MALAAQRPCSVTRWRWVRPLPPAARASCTCFIARLAAGSPPPTSCRAMRPLALPPRSVMGEAALAVGTPGDDDLGSFSGSVFILVKSGATWQPSGKITASDGTLNDSFGASVHLQDDLLVAGASGHAGTGAAYVFRPSSGFAEIAMLSPSDGADQDNFGRSVAISGTNISVGASSDDDQGTSSGSFYLFRPGRRRVHRRAKAHRRPGQRVRYLRQCHGAHRRWLRRGLAPVRQRWRRCQQRHRAGVRAPVPGRLGQR